MAEKEMNFLQPDDNRDFALLVDGKKLYVDRSYLAKWSPVFNKIFFPEGAAFEQPEGGMEMKEKKLEDFLTFLHAVFPTEKTMLVNKSNVAVLVAYADEYDVWVLRQRCVTFMGDQSADERASGETLVDCLRLASLYNCKDLQKQLVPRVAQLPIDTITAAHTQLPVAVLAAVYQSKALALQDAPSTLPENVFCCVECDSETCSISKGASSCCNKGVGIYSTAAAHVEAKCSFSCTSCSKPCSLQPLTRRLVRRSGPAYNTMPVPAFQYASCCHGSGVNVYVKWQACKDRSATAPPRKATDFSAELLDRN